MRTAFAVLFIVLIALLWFNPTMEDFSRFMEHRSEQLLLDETGDTVAGRALSALGGSLAGSYVNRATDRANYLLFSTYTLDLDGADEEGQEWRFLGIAGRFIEQDRPDALRERDERRD